MNRLLALAIVLMISVLVPEIANAQWSKASSKFSYKGVQVEVVDRRNEMGKVHHNTYGYTNFTNSDQSVNVNWRCYGVLPGSGKLVILREESFHLAPKEKRGQVYNYGAGKFKPKDFEKYVVSIEVVKDKPEVEAVGSVNSNNANKVYAGLEKKMRNDDFSQEDYAQAIEWLSFTFNTVIEPAYERFDELTAEGNEAEADRVIEELNELGDKWSKLGNYVKKAYETNKLNSANSKKFEALAKKVKNKIK